MSFYLVSIWFQPPIPNPNPPNPPNPPIPQVLVPGRHLEVPLHRAARTRTLGRGPRVGVRQAAALGHQGPMGLKF